MAWNRSNEELRGLHPSRRDALQPKDGHRSRKAGDPTKPDPEEHERLPLLRLRPVSNPLLPTDHVFPYHALHENLARVDRILRTSPFIEVPSNSCPMTKSMGFASGSRRLRTLREARRRRWEGGARWEGTPMGRVTEDERDPFGFDPSRVGSVSFWKGKYSLDRPDGPMPKHRFDVIDVLKVRRNPRIRIVAPVEKIESNRVPCASDGKAWMNARMKLGSADSRAKIRQAKRLLFLGSVFAVLLLWTGGRNFLLGSARRDLIQRIPDVVGAEMEMKMTPRNLTNEASTTTGLRPYQVRPVTSPLDQARLWNRARRMLGLHVSDNEVLIDPKQKDTAKRFYTQCGLQNLAMMNGNAVYVRIPKNGNNNIRCNILGFPGKDEDLRCLSKLEGAKLLSRGVKVWTFVRDPISRFVSGYTEVEYRNREDPDVQQQFEHPLGSKERFREYIVHLLEGRRIHAIYHTFSQSWIGTQFPVLNGGKVENMEEDWDSLQAWLGIKIPLPFNKVCSTHPTSADPLGTTAAAKRALEEDPALVNTLCALLFPDYVNFHYTMPKTCWETQDWAHLWTTED